MKGNEEEWVTECARLFTDMAAHQIGIRCPLEIVEQRDRERTNRPLAKPALSSTWFIDVYDAIWSWILHYWHEANARGR